MLLYCAKWLRAHNAPWPEFLGYEDQVEHAPGYLAMQDEGEGDVEVRYLDWTQTAIDWARAEGCTSAVRPVDDDTDSSDESNH